MTQTVTQIDIAALTTAVDRCTADLQELRRRLLPAHDKEILTTDEVMERLRCSRSTIYNLIRRGKLPRLKLGSLARYRAQDVAAIIASKS